MYRWIYYSFASLRHGSIKRHVFGVFVLSQAYWTLDDALFVWVSKEFVGSVRVHLTGINYTINFNVELGTNHYANDAKSLRWLRIITGCGKNGKNANQFARACIFRRLIWRVCVCGNQHEMILSFIRLVPLGHHYSSDFRWIIALRAVPWWIISNERWLISTFNIWMTMRPVIISLKSCSVLCSVCWEVFAINSSAFRTCGHVNCDPWLEQENWCAKIISDYVCFRRRCAQLTAYFFPLLHLMRFECISIRSSIPHLYTQ